PPRSPLFPYTTLFRSVLGRGGLAALLLERVPRAAVRALAHPAAEGGAAVRAREDFAGLGHGVERTSARVPGVPARDEVRAMIGRSEEHTSELQSREKV